MVIADLPPTLEFSSPTRVRKGRRELLYFGGCDYFRLSYHSSVRRALVEGLRRFGLNVAASRKTTGNHVLYELLEQRLARFFSAEAATLVSSGYATALVVAQASAGEVTHALLDERAHACLHNASQFLHCPVIKFRHRSLPDFYLALRRIGSASRPLVLTDGMFSHDGSLAPLGEYLSRLSSSAKILVDDAHGAGLLGAHGRGTPEVLGIRDSRLIQTITLSKAFGVAGGAILGSRRLREQILARSDWFVGSTPLPLPLASGALAALRVMGNSQSRRRRLEQKAAWVKSRLTGSEFQFASNTSPIVAWHPRSRSHGEQLERLLLQNGIHPPWIRYPGGSALGYFRFAISSAHTQVDLRELVRVLRQASALRPS